MDPWKEYAAWQDARDAVRRWALMEGKSATMSEELLQVYHVTGRPTSRLRVFGFIAHAVASLVELWRMLRSG